MGLLCALCEPFAFFAVCVPPLNRLRAQARPLPLPPSQVFWATTTPAWRALKLAFLRTLEKSSNHSPYPTADNPDPAISDSTSLSQVHMSHEPVSPLRKSSDLCGKPAPTTKVCYSAPEGNKVPPFEKRKMEHPHPRTVTARRTVTSRCSTGKSLHEHQNRSSVRLSP